MPVAIGPRRFVNQKMHHIIFQERRKQFFLAAAVQIRYIIDKNEHFHLQSTPLRQRLDRGQRLESNYLK